MANLSVWEKESFYAPQDIIIAGAGLMGLWTALELKQRRPSLSITILERNTTPLGASTRNAGFACFGSPTELIHDAATIGTDAMLELVEMRHKGIEKIKASFSPAETGLEACGGYECINRDYKGWHELDDQLHWLNELLKPITGVKTCFERTDAKIAAQALIGFDSMIENKAEASLHSGQLVSSLTKKVLSAGVSILNGIAIGHWENKGSSVNIQTNREACFMAKQLLFCTNAFTDRLLPELNIVPARGQVIVTSPIEGLPMRGTFHFDEGFYYWRNLGNRILLGGARNLAFEAETTTDMVGSDIIKKGLEDFLAAHIHPDYPYTIEHHWSGIMGFTGDKKPFSGRVSEGVFASVACNGMGVALTPIIAEQTANCLLTHF